MISNRIRRVPQPYLFGRETLCEVPLLSTEVSEDIIEPAHTKIQISRKRHISRPTVLVGRNPRRQGLPRPIVDVRKHALEGMLACSGHDVSDDTRAAFLSVNSKMTRDELPVGNHIAIEKKQERGLSLERPCVAGASTTGSRF
jgi:hypothetical protein